MPLRSVDYRQACGRYEHYQSDNVSYSTTQSRLSQIARSQQDKIPKQLSVSSWLYLSGLILPNVVRVHNSAAEPGRSAVINNNTDNALYCDLRVESQCQQMSLLPLQQHDAGSTLAKPKKRQVPQDTALINPTATASCGFGFPMATATPQASLHAVEYNKKDHTLLVTDDDDKRQVLYQARNFLSLLEMSPSRKNRLEFKWFQASAGTPITTARTEIEQPFFRSKRISTATRNQMIATHIREHCAFETEIYHPDGTKEGDILIFIAQRIDNPFRMLYDDMPGYEPSQTVSYTGKFANFVADVFSLSFKPLFGGMWANHYRKKHFLALGDQVCAERQNHITFANLATSIEVGGLPFKLQNAKPKFFPIELSDSIPLKTDHAYTVHNKDTNIANKVWIMAKQQGDATSVEKVVLTRKGTDEFDAVPLSPDNTNKEKKRVVYSEEDQTWRYADQPDSAPLDITLEEGENFITLYGEKYELRLSDDSTFEVSVKSLNGEHHRLSVYQDPLSATWHLAKINGHPAYSIGDQKLINQLKIEISPNMRFDAISTVDPELQGYGRVYEVRNRQDDVENTSPLYHVVEMNGSLIPARTVRTPNGHVYYTIYNAKSPYNDGYPIEWDGVRWQREQWTSPHVSKELVAHFKPATPATTIEKHKLSIADQQGIRWLGTQGYLRLKGEYVEIFLGDVIRLGPATDKQLSIYYALGKFYPLTTKVKELRSKSIKNDDIVDTLKDLSKDQIKNPHEFVNVERVIRNMFMSTTHNTAANAGLSANNGTLIDKLLFRQPVSVKVDTVPSTELTWKRYLVTLGDDDYFFVEISRDGQQVRVLTDNDEERAMVKHKKSLMGENVDYISTLKRDKESPTIPINSRADINNLAQQRIIAGAELIKNALEKVTGHDKTKKTLIVGHADFFKTAGFENNVFSTVDNAYKALTNAFIPLSRAYPEAIIIPGSLYISEDIPSAWRYNELLYRQGENTRPVNDAVNFSTTLVPVFHQGDFVTIARKGEYLHYKKPHAPEEKNATLISQLDTEIPRAATLLVDGVKNDPFIAPSELIGARTGAIFAGKTLLPNELNRANYYFGELPEPTPLAPGSFFFNNEFVIDGTKYLLIVEDEFIQRGETRPIVRQLIYQHEEKLEDANRYDWVIHCAAQESLDDLISAAGYNVVAASSQDMGEFSSEVVPRIRMVSYLSEKKLSLYEFLKN